MTKVIIDIGHGTDTPGKGVGKYKEHNFNSKLGLAIKRILEQHNVGVIFGQQPFSEEVPLRTRTNFYNGTGADLSVSIHANASGNPDVNGRCVFYWHDDPMAKRLAVSIRDQIKNLGYSTHGSGLHESRIGSWTNLHMTREPKMPAVLIEHGFMTGNRDFSLIFGADQDVYIRDMAEADSRAILDALGLQYKEPTEEVEVVMSDKLYRVQVGAFSNKENAERLAAELKAKGYPVYIPDAKDTVVTTSSNEPKRSDLDVAEEIYTNPDNKWGNGQARKENLASDGYDPGKIQQLINDLDKKAKAVEAGDKVRLNLSAERYATGERIPTSRKNTVYTVYKKRDDQVLLEEILSWVYQDDVTKI